MQFSFWGKVLLAATGWGIAWMLVCLKFFHMNLREALADTWWRALCFGMIVTALYMG